MNRPVVRALVSAAAAVGALLAATGPGDGAATKAASVPTATVLPRPAHVVVVVMENHSYSEIIGNASAPYINALAQHGALFTRAYAVTHPSEPNYLALFSGSTEGVTNDSCPHTFTSPNLASSLRAARLSFVGYSESLPYEGYSGCGVGEYARKHAPWVNFRQLPVSVNQPMTLFPTRFAALPTVSFVVPNLLHDMHDGSIRAGDSWLRQHLATYVAWAGTHNSLLVVTFDEDDHSQSNRIATIVYGAHVRWGRYSEVVTHYRLLRTILSLYQLPAIGASRSVPPVQDIWR